MARLQRDYMDVDDGMAVFTISLRLFLINLKTLDAPTISTTSSHRMKAERTPSPFRVIRPESSSSLGRWRVGATTIKQRII